MPEMKTKVLDDVEEALMNASESDGTVWMDVILTGRVVWLDKNIYIISKMIVENWYYVEMRANVSY